MIWINAVAFLASIVAAIGAWRMLARRRLLPRGARATSQASWQQPVLVRNRSAATQLAEIVPLALAQVAISVLLIASINRASSTPTSLAFQGPAAQGMAKTQGIYDAQMNVISWLAAVFAGAVAGVTLGALAGFALVTVFGPKVSVSVGSQGVRLGALLLRWENVAAIRLFPLQRALLVHAVDPPGSHPLVLAPPTDTQYEELARTAQEFLVARLAASTTIRPNVRNNSSPLWLGVASLLAVILALALYRASAEWAWLIHGIALVVLSWVGGRYFSSRSASMVLVLPEEAGA